MVSTQPLVLLAHVYTIYPALTGLMGRILMTRTVGVVTNILPADRDPHVLDEMIMRVDLTGRTALTE